MPADIPDTVGKELRGVGIGSAPGSTVKASQSCISMAKPAIPEAGRFVAELPKLWMRPQGKSCLGNVQIEGQVHVEQAFAQGRGVIFFGPHCGSFELGPQALAELYGPITAIYRPARKPWLAEIEETARLRPKLTVVAASLSGIRLMHKTLKANHALHADGIALLRDARRSASGIREDGGQ